MELTVPITGGVLCHLEKFYSDESFLVVGMTFLPCFWSHRFHHIK